MKILFISAVIGLVIYFWVPGHASNNYSKDIQLKNLPMDTIKLTNTDVKAAIQALEAANSKDWFSRFTADAELYDDGNKRNFKSFFEEAIGHERFTSIDKVENNGLDVYGQFHSDRWGDFKTYFKFHINSDHKIYRLEIGQASY